VIRFFRHHERRNKHHGRGHGHYHEKEKMKLKTPEVEAELNSVTTLLQDMAEQCDAISKLVAGKEITVTRVLEHINCDSGVHEARRAFDVRDEFDGQRTYTDEQAKAIVDHLNTMYPRNDGHPTALHHSFEGGPFHIHVQIAASTLTYEVKPGSNPTS